MINHDVLRLDISMDDAFVMHILQGRNDLLTVVCCFFFRKAYLGSEFLEKTLGTIFQNEVDILGIMEKSIHLQNVRVIHVHLKLDLPEDLVDHICFFYFSFAHHLQSIQTM